MSDSARVQTRFRGPVATTRSKNIAGATIVSCIVALAVTGVVGPIAAVAFFAVGAGAGYSLSGSV